MREIDAASSNLSGAGNLTDEELDTIAGGYRPVPFWVRLTIHGMVKGAEGSSMLPSAD